MNNKVNFLRGTSAEYESSIKDNDTFYYTTDDEKLYLGNKEITGGGVTIDDTLSDTSKNPVQNKVINAALNNKADLSDIPTTLPANGGNADTANGLVYHHLGDNYTMTASDFSKPGVYGIGSLASGSPNVLDEDGFNVGDFKVLALNNNPTYQMVIMTSPRYTDNRAYIGRFWDGNFIGWKRISDGGNAATVNGLTVQTAVPANAKFTDTTYGAATTSANGLMSSTDKSKLDGIATGANKYTHPSYTARTGVPTANVAPAFGGTFTVSQPVSDATGHITAINSRTITIPSTVASASAAGLVSTGAQTFAGNKTFNGQVIPAGASAVGTAQARKIYAGTSDMTAGTTALETGAIYLVYE